jgi:CHASE2 domain-containing sensor protein
MRLTPEELRARKRRNVWIAAALVAFIVLVFATTVLRLQQNQAAERALLEAATAAGPQ